MALNWDIDWDSIERAWDNVDWEGIERAWDNVKFDWDLDFINK